MINSAYEPSTDEVNVQVETINAILKRYDEGGMLIGEAPLTKDLISVTDTDFRVVSIASILMVFTIILLVMRSATLPVILVAVIELAIGINLGIPYYMGKSLLFLAPIIISTIQLGSTVDYAILLTTRYKRERLEGREKHAAVTTALATSIPSILVSALCFFAATYGVSLYSDINVISSMCTLLSRGALISLASVVFVLPALLMWLDTLVIHTTLGMKKCVQAKLK